MSDDGQATMAKWGRKMERREEEDRKATKDMKRVIAKAMQDKTTHDNITNQLSEARKGTNKLDSREGFGDDGEIITGYDEDCPWERD